MDFEQFARARDLFYLAALFLGAGCGCILNRYRIRATIRFRTLSVTAGYCFFSGAAAALFISIIFSNWTIFRETALYLPMVILIALVALIFRFPRAAGFPIFLLTGVLIVFIGYFFLRLPAIDDSVCLRVSRDGNYLVHFELFQPDELVPGQPDRSPSFSFQAAGDDSGLAINAFCLSPSKAFPLLGGVNRGLITEIRSDNTIIYTDPQFPPGFFIDPASGDNNHPRPFLRLLSPRDASTKLEIRRLLPGIHLSFHFEGDELVSR